MNAQEISDAALTLIIVPFHGARYAIGMGRAPLELAENHELVGSLSACGYHVSVVEVEEQRATMRSPAHLRSTGPLQKPCEGRRTPGVYPHPVG
jgi:hypothetical protein